MKAGHKVLVFQTNDILKMKHITKCLKARGLRDVIDVIYTETKDGWNIYLEPEHIKPQFKHLYLK